MRRFVRLAALSSAAAVGIACSRDKRPERTASGAPDLRLANAPSRAVRLNPDELTASSKPLTLAPRRVSSTHRSSLPSPTPAPATPVIMNGPLPGLETTASARLADQSAALKPKAVPVGLPSVPAAALNYDRGGFGLTPGGTPAGVVIRGGNVGDDHCDPHPRGGGIGGLFGRIFGGEGMGSGRQIP